MIVKGYLTFGILILLLFAYSAQEGRQMIDPFGITPARPTGPGQAHK